MQEKQREIVKNLRKYSKRYEEEDEALLAQVWPGRLAWLLLLPCCLLAWCRGGGRRAAARPAAALANHRVREGGQQALH